MKRILTTTRKWAPLLAAGMLFQAGGCSLDFQGVAGGLITSIINTLISSLVFGTLNLV